MFVPHRPRRGTTSPALWLPVLLACILRAPVHAATFTVASTNDASLLVTP